MIEQKLKSLEGHLAYFEMAEREMHNQLLADVDMMRKEDEANFDHMRFNRFVCQRCPQCGTLGKAGYIDGRHKLKTKFLLYPIAGARITASCEKCEYEEIFA